MKMEHLKVNKHCDCIYDIKWVVENNKFCRINRKYVERHEPTISGVAINIQLPGSKIHAQFAANDAGWMYVCDWDASHLNSIPIMDGIKEVEDNVNKWLKDNGY